MRLCCHVVIVAAHVMAAADQGGTVALEQAASCRPSRLGAVSQEQAAEAEE